MENYRLIEPDKKLICEGVELDYSNLYGENVCFSATIILSREEGQWYIENAIAEEDNEVFGVKKGDSFDPGDYIDIEQLVTDYDES